MLKTKYDNIIKPNKPKKIPIPPNKCAGLLKYFVVETMHGKSCVDWSIFTKAKLFTATLNRKMYDCISSQKKIEPPILLNFRVLAPRSSPSVC